MLGAAEEYKIALATIFVHFQHGEELVYNFRRWCVSQLCVTIGYA